MSKTMLSVVAFSTLFLFAIASAIQSTAWARAGGGSSAGNRGSKSLSSPQAPSSPSSSSAGVSTSNRNPQLGGPAQPAGGLPDRNPFFQGIAAGLAGGMIGSLLFGGTGQASPDGFAGGAIGFFEIVLFLLFLWIGYRFFRRRRSHNAPPPGRHENKRSSEQGAFPNHPQKGFADNPSPTPATVPGRGELCRGLDRMKLHDPAFREDRFKETVQDLFFRIQAGWTNRSLDGIEGILTHEMAAFYRREFESMKQKGLINRIENIVIRKVELAEAWPEAGKDCITVLITAHLLDYLVDSKSREVVEGDRFKPVKFEELWTFCRDPGSSRWRLSAINQVER